MGETMRALRLTGWQAPVAWQDVPVPEPGPGQVLVEVLATGLCHSDLNVMDAWAGWLDYPLPFTLGHEVAGRVVATGSGVDSHWDGRRVVVHGVWSCRTCRNCLRGRENHCLTLGRTERGLPRIGCGLGWDGGLAPYLLVPSPDFLVRADGVDPTVLAPLADAGLTAYHAVRQHADLLDGNSVCVVVGVGGLGHLALQVLRELGCGTVLAADTRAAARDLAARLGADHVVDDVDRLRDHARSRRCGRRVGLRRVPGHRGDRCRAARLRRPVGDGRSRGRSAGHREGRSIADRVAGVGSVLGDAGGAGGGGPARRGGSAAARDGGAPAGGRTRRVRPVAPWGRPWSRGGGAAVGSGSVRRTW